MTTLSDARSAGSRWLFPGLLGLAYAGALWQGWHGPPEARWLTLGFTTLLAGFIFGVYRWITRRLTTFGTAYDAAALYLQHPGAPPEAVPLAQVTAIRLTRTRSGRAQVWRINYRDAAGQPRELLVLPVSAPALRGLQAAVQQHNPQVDTLTSA